MSLLHGQDQSLGGTQEKESKELEQELRALLGALRPTTDASEGKRD